MNFLMKFIKTGQALACLFWAACLAQARSRNYDLCLSQTGRQAGRPSGLLGPLASTQKVLILTLENVMSTHGLWVLLSSTCANIWVSEYGNRVLVVWYWVFVSTVAVPYKLLIDLYSVQYCSSKSILFKYKISEKKYSQILRKFVERP
jgi:hypothetical protein